MATNTAKLQLRKPVDADDVDVDLDLGENFDKLDAAVDRVVANEAARTALVAYQGMRVFQVDTKATYTYDGGAWRGDGIWYDVSVPVFAAGGVSLTAASYARAMRIGRTYFLRATLLVNVGAPAGRVYFQGSGLPAPHVPGAASVYLTGAIHPRVGSVNRAICDLEWNPAEPGQWFLWDHGQITSGVNGGDYFLINTQYEAATSG